MITLSPAIPAPLFPLDLWARLDRAAAVIPTRWASWLSTTGLLQDRIAREAAEPARVRLLEERIGFLTPEQQTLLQSPSSSCFHRCIELHAGGRAWVYAETLIPDPTLEAHPWLAELGERGLGDTLSWRHDIERGPFEVASLPASHPLAERALKRTSGTHEAVWARRTWVAISGSRILVQEMFLPELRRR